MRVVRVGLIVAALWTCALPAAPANNGAVSASFSDFARAIRADDLAALKTMAASPAAANAADKLKNTPQHYAAIYGSPGAVRILLSAGADVKALNQGGASPLLYAAWSLEKTRLLVERGADVNGAENSGATPLMIAASAYGNLGTVRYLIDKGANVRALDKGQSDALIRAAWMSDPEVLQLLLARGADAHLVNVSGWNALHKATAFPDSARVRMLLDAGAGVNQFNTSSVKVRKGPIALIHLSPLMLAAPYSDVETIGALLKAGARVNEVDIRQMSPLMLAIASDHANPGVVRQLIEAGADVNAKDQNGESVLTWVLQRPSHLCFRLRSRLFFFPFRRPA